MITLLKLGVMTGKFFTYILLIPNITPTLPNLRSKYHTVLASLL